MKVTKPGHCARVSSLEPGTLFRAELDGAPQHFVRVAEIDFDDGEPTSMIVILTSPPDGDYRGLPGTHFPGVIRTPVLVFGDDVAFKIDEGSLIVGDERRRRAGNVAITDTQTFLLVQSGNDGIGFVDLATGKLFDRGIDLDKAVVFSRWSIVRQEPHGITTLASYPAPAKTPPAA